MARELKFVDSLSYALTIKAENNIEANLLREFYEQLEQDDDLLGDRKFASMSDVKEVREAFNAFYNLLPHEDEYLD